MNPPPGMDQISGERDELCREMRRIGEDGVSIEWLAPLDVEFMSSLDLPWNAEVGFDDVLAGACSDWIGDAVLPFVTALPEVIEAERSDREVIYVNLQPGTDIEALEVAVQLMWLEYIETL